MDLLGSGERVQTARYPGKIPPKTNLKTTHRNELTLSKGKYSFKVDKSRKVDPPAAKCVRRQSLFSDNDSLIRQDSLNAD